MTSMRAVPAFKSTPGFVSPLAHDKRSRAVRARFEGSGALAATRNTIDVSLCNVDAAMFQMIFNSSLWIEACISARRDAW